MFDKEAESKKYLLRKQQEQEAKKEMTMFTADHMEGLGIHQDQEDTNKHGDA